MADQNGNGSNPKPTGVCVHLRIGGTFNHKTGENRVTSVVATGAHPADAPPAPAVRDASSCGHASSGAASDAYRIGWDRMFARAPAADEAPAPAPATKPIAYMDITEQVVSTPAGRN